VDCGYRYVLSAFFLVLTVYRPEDVLRCPVSEVYAEKASCPCSVTRYGSVSIRDALRCRVQLVFGSRSVSSSPFPGLGSVLILAAGALWRDLPDPSPLFWNILERTGSYGMMFFARVFSWPLIRNSDGYLFVIFFLFSCPSSPNISRDVPGRLPGMRSSFCIV
jgi:hypothetical protein